MSLVDKNIVDPQKNNLIRVRIVLLDKSNPQNHD